MKGLTVNRWRDFQHYKDRCPPWIKLHSALLNNKEWRELSNFAAKLLIDVWLLASEHKDGIVELDSEALAWRLRLSSSESKKVPDAVQELADKGFVTVDNEDASDVLAPCYQPAIPEREAETDAEEEGETQSPPSEAVRIKELEREFESEVWPVYPKKQGKKNAESSYLKARKEGVAKERIIEQILNYVSFLEAKERDEAARYKFTKMASTWFNQRCWEDDYEVVKRRSSNPNPDQIPEPDGTEDGIWYRGDFVTKDHPLWEVACKAKGVQP